MLPLGNNVLLPAIQMFHSPSQVKYNIAAWYHALGQMPKCWSWVLEVNDVAAAEADNSWKINKEEYESWVYSGACKMGCICQEKF